jgi:hydroxymethylpyrimidine pyrophosphatase-like HAD family hydrolase
MRTSIVRDNIVNAFCEFANDIYLQKEDPDFHKFLLKEEDTPVHHIDLAELDINPNSMIIKIDEDYANEILAELAKYDDFGFRRWTSEGFTSFIEIYNKEYSKATSLDYISDYYNVPIEDFIVIGDEDNDVEMVKYAGLGVCVKNASQNLKDVADLVLDKINKEGAVGHFLEEYFQLNEK